MQLSRAQQVVVEAASDLVLMGHVMGIDPKTYFVELAGMCMGMKSAKLKTLCGVYAMAALMIDDGIKRGEKELKDMIRCFCPKCKGTVRDPYPFIEAFYKATGMTPPGPEEEAPEVSGYQPEPTADELLNGIFAGKVETSGVVDGAPIPDKGKLN